MSDHRPHGKTLMLDDGAARIYLDSHDDLNALAKIFKKANLHLVAPAHGPLPLARYNAACRAVAACVRIDEAKDIRHKAEAIRVYARQVKNPQLEADVWAIRKRAERRLGELSASLDKSKGGANPKATLAEGEKSKAEALADAGISTSSAHRYEKLASVPDDEWEILITKGREQIATGYSHADAIIKAAIKARTRPPKPAPLIIPGPLAARIKIIQSDCLDILPTINRPYTLISDPPYNIGMGYDGYDDNMPEDEYQRLLIRVFKGHPAVIILDAVKAFNLLGGGVLGRCEKIVA
jgi:hypothetical protein